MTDSHTFPEPDAMHAIYAVIGEHKTQRDQLLIMDADGQCYAWSLSTDETQPIQPDEEWRRDIPVGTDPQQLFEAPVQLGSR